MSQSKAQSAKTPKAPSHLGDKAQAEWRRLAPIAFAQGSLTPSDVPAFGLLCETLATEGYATKTGAGGAKPHPAVRAMEQARAQAARLLAAFRLTPSSRKNGVTFDPAAAASDDWGDLLDG